ncbi:putative Cupredoxin superfamily protein [Hibiscus syriacus]|uniref:Cupredoxin superfamily protein n=1 Tax=Hibiscus syriacus TaxID=106335 RepID=A0A6A2ZA99_HIBSY|nr:putative Cupredoxin superfamily protein [Hibiscus syriacus]
MLTPSCSGFKLYCFKGLHKFGRQSTILAASVFFLAGATLCAGAQHHWMLIIGRSSIVQVRDSPSPTSWSRQYSLSSLCNHRDTFCKSGRLWHIKTGWRVSLGLAGVLDTILFIGSLIITNTPASLVECGKESTGHTTLRKIRGVEDVEAEFQQIVKASEIARRVKHPFKELMKRSSLPPLIIVVCFKSFTVYRDQCHHVLCSCLVPNCWIQE